MRMNMYKKFLFSLLMLPLIGAGCARGTSAPTATNTSSDVVIEYRDGIFSPAEVRVPVGTTVIFKNVGTRSVWPASAIHPTHLLCQGFDSRRPLGPGETYSYTFATKKTCPYHNHVSATEIGKVIAE